MQARNNFDTERKQFQTTINILNEELVQAKDLLDETQQDGLQKLEYLQKHCTCSFF